MASLKFKDISFEDKKDKIKISFLRIFSAEISKKDLQSIGRFTITKNSISFPAVSGAKADKKFNFLLSTAFRSLKNKITKQKTIYIHQNSGIPLIGHNAFGLIDRNTSIIEVRPITGCNIDCIYCSVSQDKRPVDFVVEKDYLIQEFRKLLNHKQINEIEAHIGTQGEPLLYQPLAELIKDLSSMPEVSTIAIDTNGTLLTKEKVDELINAGLTRFCFSINALDQKLAKKIANKPYNLDYILEILNYISKQDVELILTPVWIPGINDKEISKLIELSKKLSCKIGIQNFLNYKFGRNPVKQMPWQEFIDKMKALEEKYNAHLLFNFKEDFNIRQTKKLPKPFRK
ncbi:radical SAM protein [Candidatus Woesearchaeota archaeon]|nr:radical SAM protein [Candidatus Woesearchaeota archaeon]